MSDDIEVLAEQKTSSYDLQVKLCRERTECRLSIRPKRRGIHFKKETILAVLEEHGIGHLLDYEIDYFVSETVQGKLDDVLVARGKLPVPGKDAAIELLVQPTSWDRHYEEDDEGNVDFRNARLFENVTAGQQIALWQPAIKGEDGYTVTDQIIPAEPGFSGWACYLRGSDPFAVRTF